ncbi:MAG TPA: transposase [Patescibacteria group bacterium]|nr:transposase [Patescibacteria group bacterium]
MYLKYNSQIHHRRSIRLSGYDYSQPGYYFITICTKNRENLFGEIKRNKMVLSAFGHLVKRHWQQIPRVRRNVALDAFIIMPNHIHGIIVIKQYHVGAIHELPRQRELPLYQRAKRRQMLLFKIIGQFKMNSVKQINLYRNSPKTSVWQRNYYEHIIRNERALNRIREYIRNNPTNWQNDRNHIKSTV